MCDSTCGTGSQVLVGETDVTPAKLCEGVDPMGRGRAKAKQTKVARELKYRTHQTDFGALAQRAAWRTRRTSLTSRTTTLEDDYDEWADYADPQRLISAADPVQQGRR